MIEAYRLHDAAQLLYDFAWHEFADKYIEEAKGRREESQVALESVCNYSIGWCGGCCRELHYCTIQKNRDVDIKCSTRIPSQGIRDSSYNMGND